MPWLDDLLVAVSAETVATACTDAVLAKYPPARRIVARPVLNSSSMHPTMPLYGWEIICTLI